MRVYKKISERGKVSRDTFEKAASILDTDKTKTVRGVAKEMSINHVTLSRYLKNKKTSGSTVAVGYSKHRQVFNEEQEKTLAEYLANCSTSCRGRTSKDKRKISYQWAVGHKLAMPKSWEINREAGRDWFISFLKRNENIIIRSPEAISPSTGPSFSHANIKQEFPPIVSKDVPYALYPTGIVSLNEPVYANHDLSSFVTERPNQTEFGHRLLPLEQQTSETRTKMKEAPFVLEQPMKNEENETTLAVEQTEPGSLLHPHFPTASAPLCSPGPSGLQIFSFTTEEVKPYPKEEQRKEKGYDDNKSNDQTNGSQNSNVDDTCPKTPNTSVPDEIQSQDETNIEMKQSPSASSPPTPQTQQQNDFADDSQSVQNYTSAEEDHEIFGAFIASELRGLGDNFSLIRSVKKKIQLTIIEAYETYEAQKCRQTSTQTEEVSLKQPHPPPERPDKPIKIEHVDDDD